MLAVCIVETNSCFLAGRCAGGCRDGVVCLRRPSLPRRPPGAPPAQTPAHGQEPPSNVYSPSPFDALLHLTRSHPQWVPPKSLCVASPFDTWLCHHCCTGRGGVLPAARRAGRTTAWRRLPRVHHQHSRGGAGGERAALRHTQAQRHRLHARRDAENHPGERPKMAWQQKPPMATSDCVLFKQFLEGFKHSLSAYSEHFHAKHSIDIILRCLLCHHQVSCWLWGCVRQDLQLFLCPHSHVGFAPHNQ